MVKKKTTAMLLTSEVRPKNLTHTEFLRIQKLKGESNTLLYIKVCNFKLPFELCSVMLFSS